MAWVAGVDGCRAGWVIALRDLRESSCAFSEAATFEEVLDRTRLAAIIAIDIPIGILDGAPKGGRDCDREARRLLGQPRQCSVFSPPCRAALLATSYRDAQRLNQPAGLTLQSFSLLPKIREVDTMMSHHVQARVREVHPELCFFSADGRKPMTHGKKSRPGRDERLAVLAQLYGGDWEAWWTRVQSMFDRRWVMSDDIVDAHIAAWTAERIYLGAAERVPQDPPVDSHGLRMEMWC